MTSSDYVKSEHAMESRSPSQNRDPVWPRLLSTVRSLLPDFPSRGIVAVSGGADSVALLRILHQLSIQGRFDSSEHQPGPVELAVAHLNHLLRGEESERDEQFVRDLARQLEVRCFVERVDVASIARSERGNLEDIARRLRYHWLGKLAREQAACWVATGHTADDQAETILFRLIRGTGIRGLTGIYPRRMLTTGVELLRPLLGCTRKELVRFLQGLGQIWQEDSTNSCFSRTRNRIRRELLPLLETYNPAIRRTLNALGDQAREMTDELLERAAAVLQAAERPAAQPLRILSVQVLCSVPEHIAQGALYALWEREKWALGQMTHRHWKQLLKVLKGHVAALDLPGGIRARRFDNVLQVGPQQCLTEESKVTAASDETSE